MTAAIFGGGHGFCAWCPAAEGTCLLDIWVCLQLGLTLVGAAKVNVV